MLEHWNLLWFSWLNAAAGLHGWPLQLGLFIAERVILLVPFGLVLLWMSGDAARRAAAVKALAAISCALAGNASSKGKAKARRGMAAVQYEIGADSNGTRAARPIKKTAAAS